MSEIKSKSVAFYERGSWYHRTKELQDDYKVKYGKKEDLKQEKKLKKVIFCVMKLS